MKKIVFLLALAAMFHLGSNVQAAFTLKIDSGANSETINLATGGIVAGSGASWGASTFTSSNAKINNLTFFGYTVDVSVLKNNSPGSVVLGSQSLALSSLSVSGAFNTSIKFTLFDDGYTNPTPVRVLTGKFTSNFEDGATTANYSSTYNNGSPSSVTDTLTGSTQASTKIKILSNSNVGYSLTSTYELNGVASNTLLTSGSVSSSIQPTPAPAGLLLGLLGVPAFGLIARRWGGSKSTVQPLVA